MTKSPDAETESTPTQDSPIGARIVLYLAFAAAVFVPYGLNLPYGLHLLVMAAAWALAWTIKPRDIPRNILLTVLSLAGSALWAFLPA